MEDTNGRPQSTNTVLTRRKWYLACLIAFILLQAPWYIILDSWKKQEIQKRTLEMMMEEHWTTNVYLRWAISIFNWIVYTAGMEFYSRYAHRDLWHGSLWYYHRTHHEKHKNDPNSKFELNDIFGVGSFIFVYPPLMFLSFYPHPCLASQAIVGALAGISTFGSVYILVHDGLHHNRFDPALTECLASFPWLKKVADTHALHHTAKMGPPYGLFLGPQEVEAHNKGLTVAPIPWWLKTCLVVGVLPVFLTKWA